MKTNSLTRAVALPEDHQHDLRTFFTRHLQGAMLPGFLIELAKHFAAEQSVMLRELDSVRGNLNHINQIVATQQSYSGRGGITEMVSIAGVISDALRMNEEALDGYGALVIKDLDPQLPDLEIDRHKVLQILVNLIRNAKRALQDSPAEGREMSVRAFSSNGRSLQICVADTGAGIPAENLARIFEHGFSTRKNGHGFGLHASALAARQMGGELRVTSDGPSRGATFILELPLTSKNSKTGSRVTEPRFAATK